MKKDRLIKIYILKAAEKNFAAHCCQNKKYRGVLYREKESLYKKALELLKSSKHSKIKYKKERRPDQNGYASHIFYFEWNEGGEKIQFSFHCPLPIDSKDKNYFIEGVESIQWNGIKGKDLENYKKLKDKYLN